jgi:gliding motility-associated-like protein
MKRFFTSLALFLIPFLASSQCKVVINEILFSPSSQASNSMHGYSLIPSDSCAEWVELYNPSSCESVDISCWVLGSDEGTDGNGNRNNGAFVFPQGTTIPPHGFVVVGGTSAPTKDFDANKSQYFCGSDRWYLSNSSGWIGLFKNDGSVVNAVYWSTLGQIALSSGSEFANSMTTASYKCICSGTTMNSTPAKNISGMEYAGQSSGGLGEGWKRTIDGGSTWEKELATQATPKSCNGPCAQPLRASVSGTNPATCQDKGTASVTVTGGTPPYTYLWDDGSTSTSLSNLSPGNYTCTVTDACGCKTSGNVTITPVNISFTVSATKTEPLCNGGTGSITTTVTPAGGNYTYKWNTSPVQTTSSITNVPPGDYTVEVTEKGCTSSKTITIKQPDKIDISFTTVASTCKAADGSATAEVKGGTGPYNYSWSTTPVQETQTAQNLLSGSYTVNITDANGCKESKSVTVEKKGNLSATVTGIDEKCGMKNGSVTIDAVGGITYTWNTVPVQTTKTAVDLHAGTYTGTVEDAKGCAATQTITIKNITTISVEVSGTPALCRSSTGTATVNVKTGDAPYTYAWNTSPAQTTATAINLAPGKYSCEVTDRTKCKVTIEVEITAIVKELTATTSSTKAICTTNNGTAEVTPTSGTSPYYYLWNNGEITPQITGLAPGTYSVEFLDKNGCQGKFSVPVGNIVDTLKITPTIVDETCTNKNGKITAVVSGGTLPYRYNWNNINTPTSNLENIPAGTYTLIAADSFGCTGTKTMEVKNIVTIAVNSVIKPDTCVKGVGSIELIPASGQAPYTYLWSTADTTKGLQNLSEGVYTATVKDALGCKNTTQYAVENINYVFNGSILGNRSLQQDEESIISIVLPPNWTLKYWVGIDGDTLRTPRIRLFVPYPRYGDFTIQVAVKSSYGCEELITLPVYVEPSWTFYIPNCITVNYDYFNDKFFPKFTGISEMQGWVFDRWGRKIYTFKNMYDTWDGYYNGEKVQQDVYVYKFKFKDLKGIDHEKSGILTVLNAGH